MLVYEMKCQNCSNTNFYILANDYIKCKNCAKKYSLKKIEKDKQIAISFSQNKNALETSKELQLNYKTVKDRFDIYRKEIAIYLEDQYNNSVKDNTEYEEFYYIKEREKKKKKKSLSQAINIMGFYSNEKIYTILMPKIGKRAFDIEDGFIEYLNWHKIHSKNSYQSKLNEFWKFLEENLKKYKGVEEENFFFYLKECEFRFNYSQKEQLEIIKNLYKI
jgi:transposase